MCQTRRLQSSDLPMSSKPPIYHAECPYRVIRWRWRCGQIKVVPRNVSQMPKVEMTYLGHTGIAQPWVSKCSNRVIGPCHRRDRIKIIPVKLKIERLNDKSAQEDKRTYRRRAQAMQPLLNAPNRRYGVHRPIRQRGCIKIEPTNIN